MAKYNYQWRAKSFCCKLNAANLGRSDNIASNPDYK